MTIKRTIGRLCPPQSVADGSDTAARQPLALGGAVLLLVSLQAGSALADMIDTADMSAWEVCALCHGADGISATSKFPKLAGQKPAYIKQQLLDFRAGSRSNDGGQMQAISTEVAAEEIDMVVQYFASLAPPDTGLTEDSKRGKALLVGKQIFEQGREGLPACAECHADAKSAAPWLDAQHQEYLQKQLRDFAVGARESRLSTMNDIAMKLDEAEIEAISVYLESTQISRTE